MTDEPRRTEPAGLEAIFHVAREMTPGEARDAYVARACVGDPVLRARLEEMLWAHDRAGDFLATKEGARAGTTLPGPNAGVGQTIGRFRLLQLIGEGGFGAVYMAEQSEPVRRKVALKVIKPGMDTRMVAARFEAERQALAVMDHPHIARILDGGITDASLGSRPYFVMEYVIGDPVTAFARAHDLTLGDRLALFTQVCEAVQHAHTKGIIHRDLKPTNILVSMTDGRPFAKVIDFGIAKAMGRPLTDKTLFTEHRQLIGTPEYMSPEQAEGLADIDTRTDVYALGVLLYELLTGDTPFDAARLRSAALGEMQRIIRNEEPPSPSVRVTKRLTKEPLQRATDAQARPDHESGEKPRRAHAIAASDLKGELDWIVMKALDKDRARRYETPSALAADVQRHLAGEAVVAAPPSTAYRMRKFVRRHKGPVIAGTAVTAALLLGIAGTTWGWGEARRVNAKLGDANRELEARRLAVQAVAEDVGRAVARASREGINVEGVPNLDPSLNRPMDVTSATLEQLGMMRDYAVAWIEYAVQKHRELAKKNSDLKAQARIAREGLRNAAITMGGQPDELLEGMPLAIEAGRRARADADGVPFTPMEKGELELLALVTIAEGSTKRLMEQTDAAEWSAYTANLALAQAAMEAMNWREARRRLTLCPEGKRGWEWKYLDARARGIIAQVPGEIIPGPGGRYITIAPDGRTVRVMTSDGEFVGEPMRVRTDVEGAVIEVVFSPDGTRVLARMGTGVVVWNGSTGSPIGETLEHEFHVNAAVFSPDSRRLLTVSRGSVAQLWDAATLQPIGEPMPHVGAVTGVVFSPDGNLVATESDDYTIRLWDAVACTPIGEPIRHAATICSIEFSPDGTRLLTASRDGTARLFSTKTGAPIGEVLRHAGYILRARFSPEGERVVTASHDHTARMWEAATGAPMGEPMRHDDVVSDAVFSPDGTCVVTVSVDCTARLWDAITAAPVGEPMRHEYSCDHAEFSRDGGRVMTASSDGTARVWDGETAEPLGAPLRMHGSILQAGFDVDGERGYVWNFNSYSSPGSCLLWDLDATDALRPIADNDQLALVLAFEKATAEPPLTAPRVALAPDGRAAFDPPVLEPALESLPAIDGRFTALALAPDGERVVTGDARGMVRFWEAEGWREVGVFQFEQAITGLTFTHAGAALVIEHARDSDYQAAAVFDTRSLAAQNAEWRARIAEQAPAEAYVDALWNDVVVGPDGRTVPRVASDALLDAIRADASLTPLRRLTAGVVVEARLSAASREAWRLRDEIVRAPQAEANAQWMAMHPSDEAARAALIERTHAGVQAAAAAVEAHPRVRAMVEMRASEWTYSPPEHDDAKVLARAQRLFDFAKTELDASVDGTDTGAVARAVDLLRDVLETRARLLGANHVETVKARWQVAFGEGALSVPGGQDDARILAAVERVAAEFEAAGGAADSALALEYIWAMDAKVDDEDLEGKVRWLRRLALAIPSIVANEGEAVAYKGVCVPLMDRDLPDVPRQAAKDEVERFARVLSAIDVPTLVEREAGWAAGSARTDAEEARREKARRVLERASSALEGSPGEPRLLSAAAIGRLLLGENEEAIERARESEAARAARGMNPSSGNAAVVAIALSVAGRRSDAAIEAARASALWDGQGRTEPYFGRLVEWAEVAAR